MGRDVDRGIEAEPTGGSPGEHVIGDVTFEQPLAVEVLEHAVAHGVLQLVPDESGKHLYSGAKVSDAVRILPMPRLRRGFALSQGTKR